MSPFDLRSCLSIKKPKTSKTTTTRGTNADVASDVRRHVARIDALLDIIEGKIRETPINCPTTLTELLRAADSLMMRRQAFLDIAAPSSRSSERDENQKANKTEWGVPADLVARGIVDDDGDRVGGKKD